MGRQTVFWALCSSFTVLTGGCATENFVHTQLGASESKLSQRADISDSIVKQPSGIARFGGGRRMPFVRFPLP